MARSSFSVTYRAKDFFFDRQRVIARMQASKLKMLARCGVYLRREGRKGIKQKTRAKEEKRFARQSKEMAIGKRESVRGIHSAPGAPPYSWQPNEPNIRTILYSYDPTTDSVVVGPVIIPRSRAAERHDSQPVPSKLEHGGDVYIPEWSYADRPARWTPGRPPRRAGRPTRERTRRGRIEPRPNMGRALRKVAPTFPELF